MSPTPLIDLQRKLSIVGAIRCGERTDKGAPKRLDTFRITSPDRHLADQAAGLYGGEVTDWQSPSGPEWQVTTTTQELPVLVMPAYSLKQTYELWEGATKRTRVCDGQEMSDGAPCACETEGEDKCDLYTRLVVALPELDTVLGWRLITKGINAGLELPTLMSLIQSVSNGRPFVPAKLRLIERRGVKDGQTVRYVVPTLDLGAGFAALAAHALPAADAPAELGYTAAPPRAIEAATVTVKDGLEAAATPRKSTSGRTAAPIGDVDDDFDTAPTPPGNDTPVVDYATAAQKRKLNVLIGKLRPGQISTEQLYAALAKTRAVDSEHMISLLNGRDHDGVLHWSPLRDSLTKTEANNLIDRLSKLEETL